MKNISVFSSLSLVFFLNGLTACDQRAQTSMIQAAWNAANNPAIISSLQYEKNWNKLPLQGQIEVKGWSDDYWRTAHGGIAYRWSDDEIGYNLLDESDLAAIDLSILSPAEKYDVYMGRYDFPTVKDERRRTKVMKTVAESPEFDPNFEIPGWEGLCHGWAPAALNFLSPTGTVKVQTPVGELDFYPSDIKALLIYYQQYPGNRSTRTSFVSARCGVEFAKLDEQLNMGEITKDEWEAARNSDACADANPGTFHLVLSNELAIKKQGFVVDITRDFEVWNQPVNGFASEVISDEKKASEGAAPGTVREIAVRTTMNYTVETPPTDYAQDPFERELEYEYVLELNEADEIIGGRWISEERPDFLWRETAPIFRGYFSSIRDLYEKGLVAGEGAAH